MSRRREKQELSHDLRVFLFEVGEAVKEYLNARHGQSRTRTGKSRVL